MFPEKIHPTYQTTTLLHRDEKGTVFEERMSAIDGGHFDSLLELEVEDEGDEDPPPWVLPL